MQEEQSEALKAKSSFFCFSANTWALGVTRVLPSYMFEMHWQSSRGGVDLGVDRRCNNSVCSVLDICCQFLHSWPLALYQLALPFWQIHACNLWDLSPSVVCSDTSSPVIFSPYRTWIFFSMKAYKTLKMDNSSPSPQSSPFISIKLLSFNPRPYLDTENSLFPSLLQLPFYIFKRVIASLKPQPPLD